MADLKRTEIIEMMYKFASDNPNYRAAMLKDPKAVLAKQMGAEIPDWLNVKVVEETADTSYLVVPRLATAAGDELSDADLEKVAGGGKKGDDDFNNTYTCNDVAGVGTRVEINTEVSVF